MSKLKEKIRQLDNLNLKTNDANDLVYEILSEMADRIEKLEGNSSKARKYHVNHYIGDVNFSQTGRVIFGYDTLAEFIERIIEDRE